MNRPGQSNYIHEQGSQPELTSQQLDSKADHQQYSTQDKAPKQKPNTLRKDQSLIPKPAVAEEYRRFLNQGSGKRLPTVQLVLNGSTS